ncbi:MULTISPECIES: NAD(+) diphosphatase [unclassified Brevundimonas]|uniref:NAD(+) diphosphatase n=1 Tax=unclassified Brevundimonas TaxID=2622653 RepID=UPI0025B96ACD|nr:MULTISPECIES: NAD(+) diphosphatase [unclassified Brevundimonas]
MVLQNTFSGNPLDRSGDLRNDAEWIASQRRHPRATCLVLWEGRVLVEPFEDGERLVWLSFEHALDLVKDRDLFLGLWKDIPAFAIEFEGSIDPTSGPCEHMGRFVELREAAAILSAQEAAMAGEAKVLFDWRRRHGFCSACGKATEQASGGWRRVCRACGTEHFPRVDPVVIMLPVYKGGDEPVALLGRQPQWPKGRMSALAGFLEPAESIEEACAREVKEEAGLTVTSVKYHSSQPWPFPSQLMVGLIAEVDSNEAVPDHSELEAVIWLTRAEARALVDGSHPDLIAPPPFAIAHQLISSWAYGED